jgi:hypothetical protein
MHSAKLALETLEYLRHNLHLLRKQVDIQMIPWDKQEELVKKNPPVRPFRRATWLALQGFFMSAWGLWEYYTRCLCEGLPVREKKKGNESTPDWFSRWLAANDRPCPDLAWFSNANSLRNIMIHSGTRVFDDEGRRRLDRAKGAFPNLHTFQDGYVSLTGDQMSELTVRIEEFIRNTASFCHDS